MKKKIFVILLILCCICSTGCKNEQVKSTYETKEEEVIYFEDATTTWEDVDEEWDSVSPEYLAELEYNSKTNVYPEGMD